MLSADSWNTCKAGCAAYQFQSSVEQSTAVTAFLSVLIRRRPAAYLLFHLVIKGASACSDEIHSHTYLHKGPLGAGINPVVFFFYFCSLHFHKAQPLVQLLCFDDSGWILMMASSFGEKF